MTPDAPPWMTELEAVPVEMAAAVRAVLPQVTRERYIDFLDMMFHYTRHSGARLEAAAHSATDPALADFFAELASEEADHYRLAEADLRAFDRTPTQTTPAEVVAFESTWASLSDAGELAVLGALYVLEGVADHLADDARGALLGLGLDKRQARFVLVHLEADEAHGALCREHALRCGASDPTVLLDGARRAAQAWIAMHEAPLAAR